MKVLITGAKGQLGQELKRAIELGATDLGAVPKAYQGAKLVLTDVDELDIADAAAVDAMLSEGFDVVFNCAAYTNVDGCEEHEDDAFAANATGPAHLAAACERFGGVLVQVSTDYVFSGTDANPRVETDTPNPVSAYGRTKLAGEHMVASACARYFIVRTAWLYGLGGRNFVETMLRFGAEKDEILVVNDQFGNPTYTADLVYHMLLLAQSTDYGIYHCTNEGTCSWADFAQAIMQEAGLACRVQGCTTEEYRALNPNSAARPAYSSLENAHLATTVGNFMRPWREALKSYVAARTLAI